MSKILNQGTLSKTKVSLLSTAIAVAIGGFGAAANAAGPTLSDADFEKSKYTLSLHDALPISEERRVGKECTCIL